jgi:DNA-binding transcriptional ArsR family regulator
MSQEVEPSADDSTPSRTAGLAGMRQLTDPRDMRALAHPIRLALLEVLTVYGPLTATQAGELIGESPSSCSFHLRTLARHHFVEETGEGRGRERPWRLVTLGMSISDVPAGSETFVAAAALTQIVTERQLDRLRHWWGRRSTVDQVWLDATSQSDFMAWLTPVELRKINDTIRDVMAQHHDRLTDPASRPADAQLVEMLYFSYLSAIGQPTEPSAADSPADQAD